MSPVTAPVRRPLAATAADQDRVARGRRARGRRRLAACGALAAATAAVFLVSLMVGHTFYGPGDVLRVLSGQVVPGASFTVGELRLPRASTGALAGAAFGIAGVTFQTMLRNALASPDVIGISSGASAAAVYAIVVLSVSEAVVSAMAVIAALLTAVAIYLLASRDGVAGARLVLIGIGINAMLHSVISYLLLRAAQWDLQTAMRWLTGSINGATWDEVVPLALAVAVLVPLLLGRSRHLGAMQIGDDTATVLGVRVERTRPVIILTAVALIAFATAAAGPIAFVAFLAGPIAARLVGQGGSLLVPAALVGALLVLGADLIGQWAFDTRYPVGVITGALGAPYLLYLLVRSNSTGGTL
ncbi:FecCD family ABC transporter permease [Marmoricola sp. RAF53]|uniref:FecCD family ABC transporter permease n=1 Tax=Marmoricola sp. RAF53 TaxID=3233059 RepID=UPI003F9AE6F6